MTATAVAGDLNALHSPASVAVAIDGAGNGVKEGGPAATGVELGSGFVKGAVAASTCVHTVLGIVLIEFACAGGLGAFLAQDSELFGIEFGAPLSFRHTLGERLRSAL